MAPHTRRLIWCIVSPTIAMLGFGVISTLLTIAIERELDPNGRGASTVGTHAVWWAGSGLVTCVVVTAACILLERAERQLRPSGRTLRAAGIGALSPLSALVLSALWVNLFAPPSGGGAFHAYIHPSPLVTLGPAVLAVLAPGVFLHLVRRSAHARA